MILVRTPYRVGLAGGGTDLPAVYRAGGGAVVNFAIRKYFYISVTDRLLPDLRVAYSRTECVADVASLKHEIVRAALQHLHLGPHLEIAMTGEVPAGTGLGSSSAVSVGVLHALHGWLRRPVTPADLAALACRLEIDWLGKPIGKQDQYGAAIGGLKLLIFRPDEGVEVRPIPLDQAARNQFEQHLLLVYTGRTRKADTVLRRQGRNATAHRSGSAAMRALAVDLAQALAGGRDWRAIGLMIEEGWKLKLGFDKGITFDLVDAWYGKAKAAGAWGGKLLGAGAGGFLLLVAPPERHAAIRSALGSPPTLPVSISDAGSEIVFDDRRGGEAASAAAERPRRARQAGSDA